MFIKVPFYNASLENEPRSMNTDHFEEIYPHANVPVDPGAVDTPCCEVRFFSGETRVILLDKTVFETALNASTGLTDLTGLLT